MLTFAALTVCKLLGSMRYERTFLIIIIKNTQKTTNTNQPKVATFRLETASVRGRNLCRNCFSKKKKSVQSQSTNAVSWCHSSKISGAGSDYTSSGFGPKRINMDSTTESKMDENTAKSR